MDGEQGTPARELRAGLLAAGVNLPTSLLASGNGEREVGLGDGDWRPAAGG